MRARAVREEGGLDPPRDGNANPTRSITTWGWGRQKKQTNKKLILSISVSIALCPDHCGGMPDPGGGRLLESSGF